MQPGDRLVCAFVGSDKVEKTFINWPLHVTVVPWFRVKLATDELAHLLEEQLQTISSFNVTIGSKAYFGHERREVNLLKLPNPFMTIEQIVRQTLHAQKAWLVDETTKRLLAYRPHVTKQGPHGMHSGDNFVCSQLNIVEQTGEYKEVMATIGLKHA